MRLRVLAASLMLVVCVALSVPAEAREVLLVSIAGGWSKYDCATGAYLGQFQGLSGTRVVAAEPGGILDVYAGNGIMRYDVGSGKSVGSISLLGYSGGCQGLAWGPDGRLYLANTYSSRILRCDVSTGVVEVVPLSVSIREPLGITFGTEGGLYACAYWPDSTGPGREVGRIRLSDGSMVEKYQGTADLQAPQQLASTSDGSVYALNQCAFGLYKLNPSAGRFDEIVPGGPQLGFDNMAFGANGAAFLTQYDSSTRGFSVRRYDPQSGSLTYFAPGGTGYVAVVTIPEPSGAAVLMAALGALAIARRLRRR
jgi:hypothetical protein